MTNFLELFQMDEQLLERIAESKKRWNIETLCRCIPSKRVDT